MTAVAVTAPDDDEDVDEGDGRFGSLGSIVHLLVLAWAAAIASFPLNDNSFFTHLATGRIILDEGSVPSRDPYTFTAQGEPWTVQSWLASVAYAGFERLAGDLGLRFLVLTVFLVAATLLWRLTAPAGSIITRLLVTSLGLFVVSDLWSERPYMIGVIGLSVVWLALEGRVRPWLLVPLLWVWTNAHGSFPLAVALCGAVLVGGVLDRRAAGEPLQLPERERRTAGAVLLGIILGAIGPLGPKVWLFPLSAMTKSGTFAEIIEWRAPTYQSVAERAFLGLVVVTVLLLASRRPVRWRLLIPAVGFLAMGLFAQRNVVMAAVVLVAVGARSAPAVGTLMSRDRVSIGPAVAALFGVLLLVVGALALTSPVLAPQSLGGYPARALAVLGPVHGSSSRTAAEASTGNLQQVLDGASAAVFVDDRVDMFPEVVFRDSLRLGRAEPGWRAVLDRYDVDVVLWRRSSPLGSLLAADPGWAVTYSDESAVIACRRGRACPVGRLQVP